MTRILVFCALGIAGLSSVGYAADLPLPSASATIIPDRAIFPGATNPAITQANINKNICNKRWSTKSIRPTSSFTTKLKVQQLKALGWKDQNKAHYEEDHIISLEIGGAPKDPKNLWPQSYLTHPGAKDKDKCENALHRAVCTGTMTLAEAQKRISTDWLTNCAAIVPALRKFLTKARPT